MKNANGNYMLKMGHFEYEVSGKVKKILEGVMYWSHCKKLDAERLKAAEQQLKKDGERCRISPEEIKNLRDCVDESNKSLHCAMNAMDDADVPNWVGNGAMHWATTHDLRETYLTDFFEKSKYSVKENIELSMG